MRTIKKLYIKSFVHDVALSPTIQKTLGVPTPWALPCCHDFVLNRTLPTASIRRFYALQLTATPLVAVSICWAPANLPLSEAARLLVAVLG